MIPNCSLFVGDNVEVLRREVQDNTVQLTVTSPPYDNLRKYNGFTWDFEALARELYRVTKPGGVIVWVVADATVNGSETGTSFRQALYLRDVCGFNLHDTMIYHKQSQPRQNGVRYEQHFEYMLVLSKGQTRLLNPVRVPCKNAGKPHKRTCRDGGGDILIYSENVTADTKIPGNVWTFNVGSGAADANAFKHPATFPEQLAQDHVLSWSNPGDLVLDPFLGSGTTGKMALLNSRRFIGCDISPAYVDLSAGRIRKALNLE